MFFNLLQYTVINGIYIIVFIMTKFKLLKKIHSVKLMYMVLNIDKLIVIK